MGPNEHYPDLTAEWNRVMGPDEDVPTTGEQAEASTRDRQIRDFEYHWERDDGSKWYTGTEYKGGEWRTTAETGHVLAAETMTELREIAREYYSEQHQSSRNPSSC
jgi:hypothetical protein